MNIDQLSDIQAEAGIISTLILKPDFIFHSDCLNPHHFYNNENGIIYYAISELAKKGNVNIDAYNIMMILNSHKSTEDLYKSITTQSLNELIEVGKIIARENINEYLILVENVLDKAFRREIFKELQQCQALCFKESEENIKNIVFNRIDKTIANFSGIEKIPNFADIIDNLWASVLDRHNNGGMCGLPSKFTAVNEYFTYEKSELILVCGARKDGKSIIAMNEIVHKLEMGNSVLEIDTEMSDRQHMERMLSHLTQIPVKLIKNGAYGTEEAKKINNAIAWIKSKRYIHLYMPTPDLNKIYSIVKRMKMNNNIDFVVYDYLKSQNSISANEIYNMLGDYCNFLKNRIAGELEVPVLALAQLSRSGDIADSFKLEQFASTVALIRRKKPEEIQRDGVRCGNYKFYVKLNRLGEQMADIEYDYVDLNFNGNTVTFEQAEQHVDVTPFN